MFPWISVWWKGTNTWFCGTQDTKKWINYWEYLNFQIKSSKRFLKIRQSCDFDNNWHLYKLMNLQLPQNMMPVNREYRSTIWICSNGCVVVANGSGNIGIVTRVQQYNSTIILFCLCNLPTMYHSTTILLFCLCNVLTMPHYLQPVVSRDIWSIFVISYVKIYMDTW